MGAPDGRVEGRAGDAWSRTPRLVLPAIIALVTLAAFLPALWNGFVDYDDRPLIVDNVHFQGLGWHQLAWMFTTTLGGPYLPLTWLSFAVDYTVWGLDPFGFHLTNLLLHAANAVLFYVLALRLLALAVTGVTDTARCAGAAVAALLFAVHPLRVESVAWATGRKDVLSAFFYLLAVLWYVRAATGPATRVPGWRWASVAAFALSLLAKGIGITLPLVLVVLDAYPLRRLPADPRRWGAAPARAVLGEKLPYIVLAVAAAAVGVVGQAQAASIVSLGERPLGIRAVTVVYGLAFYLWRTVVPTGLTPMHHLPLPFDPLAPRYVASVMVVVASVTLAAVGARRRPAVLAAWLVYALTLAPVLGIVQLGRQLVAERYSYLACLGWALLVGGGVMVALHRDDARARYGSLVLAAGAVLALTAATWRQSTVWHDPATLWRHALAIDATNYVAHHYLALTLAADGQDEDALAHEEEATRLAPGLVAAHKQAAELYAARGAPAAALAHYQAALIVAPDDADLEYNLGLLLHLEGQLDEAIAHYRAALRIDPEHADAHDNLGGALYRQGKVQEAVAHFEAALRVDPARAGTHQNLGAAWAKLGQLQAAAGEFRAALRLDPTREDARRSLERITPYLQGGH